ncbi:MAG TPA: Ig-like domain-containing protein, partial [Arenibaculum sp.]|nr:Ig-like domain-containing protein [Arenibaculum sp.]
MITSDDFSSGSLAPLWQDVGPAGTITTAADDADAYLRIAVPQGSYDPWHSNGALRVMQDTTDGDLTVTAAFLSQPSAAFQMQGILVEQDAGNWLRFDTFHDGSTLRLFAAVTLDGQSTARINVAIADGDAARLRVVREGDTWTFQHSADGDAWTTAGSFAQALNVTAIGPFAGATAGAPAFTARVDWFESAGDPITDEDAALAGAPRPADDSVATTAGTALVLDIAGDLLANDVDPDGDALSFAGFEQPQHGTLADNGDGTLVYTPAAGFSGTDSFRYLVSDGTATAGATVEVAVAAPPPASAEITSDDSSSGSLAPLWQGIGPAGTITTAAGDADAYL